MLYENQTKVASQVRKIKLSDDQVGSRMTSMLSPSKHALGIYATCIFANANHRCQLVKAGPQGENKLHVATCCNY